MSTNFLFFGNGPYLNRGCEAIVRGTVEILRKSFGEDASFTNAYFPQDDGSSMEESDTSLSHRPLPSKWFPFPILKGEGHGDLFSFFMRRLPYRIRISERLQQSWMNHLARKIFEMELSDSLRSCEIALALGGDNYTLDYGFPTVFLMLDHVIRKSGKPIAIWGASVGPFEQSPHSSFIRENLRNDIDLFFVREQKSLDYLTAHGFAKNTHLISDPAFAMKPVPVDAKELGFEIPAGALGLNLSPLMARYVCERNREQWTLRCIDILRSLLEEFDRPVLLIPHVTLPNNDDHDLLDSVKQKLPEFSDRIFSVHKSFGAAQLKWIISQCSCLIAARTHATIAAFSTAVPTVSLAYSVKAFGLNESLFGHTRYLVPPEDMTPQRVVATTRLVLEQSEAISESLKEQQQKNLANAYAAGEILRDYLQKR